MVKNWDNAWRVMVAGVFICQTLCAKQEIGSLNQISFEAAMSSSCCPWGTVNRNWTQMIVFQNNPDKKKEGNREKGNKEDQPTYTC